MDQPVISSAPVTSEPAPYTQTEARLERIEKSLETISKQLPPLPDTTSSPLSKPLLAAGFGFAGFKLGGLFIGKFGLIADLTRSISNKGFMSGIKEVFGTLITFGSNTKDAMHILKYTIVVGGVGSVVGAVGGALLGWNRGDRLKSPGELFSHPIDSMKKIFGPAPVTPPAPAPDEQKTAPVLVQTAQHEGTVIAEQLKAAQR